MEENSHKILFVEDDEIDIMAFERYASQNDFPYQYHLAQSVTQGFKKLEEEDIDIIISDYGLNDGKGFDFLSNDRNIPTIIVTGAGDEELAIEAMRQGAYDYIIKSIDNSHLKILDVTIAKTLRHHQAEINFAESEKRYRSLVEFSDDIIFRSDPYGFVTFANQYALNVSGKSKEELIGAHFNEYVREDHKPRVAEFYKKCHLERRESSYLEFPAIVKDNQEIWVGQKVKAIFDPGNPEIIQSYFVTARDITAQKTAEVELEIAKRELEVRVEERTKALALANKVLTEEIAQRRKTEVALRESQEFYKNLFDNSHEAIVIFHPITLRIIDINDLACTIYGWKKKELLGITIQAFYQRNEGPKEHVVSILASDGPYRYNTTHVNRQGRIMNMDISASKIPYSGEEAILSVNKDITAELEMQANLHQERKRRMSALIDGQELERKRLSKELHDGLGQLLTASIIHIRRVEKSDKIQEKQKKALGHALSIVEDTMTEVRNISQDLMPSVLADFGLQPALQKMAERLNQVSKIEISLKSPSKELTRLNQTVEMSLYRIAQEAVNNALKYSKAKKIFIELYETEPSIIMSIVDDGVGFEACTSDDVSGGNGIYNMKERARIFDGEISIKSAPKKGTSIKVKYNQKSD